MPAFNMHSRPELFSDWGLRFARSFGVRRFQTSEPKIEICSSGSSCGFSGSRSSDQSIRVLPFHCRSLPFSYRFSSEARPSSYSQRMSESKRLGMIHSG